MKFFSKKGLTDFFGLDSSEEEDVIPEKNLTPPEKREVLKEKSGENDYEENTPRETRKENIVPMRQTEKKVTKQPMTAQITIVEPRVYSEALPIAKKIVNNEAVIINFHLIEEAQARRIVDFLTGTVYALRGDIQRIGTEIFLCTPENIEIDGATAKSILQDEFQQF